MDLKTTTFLVVGFTFALYIWIAIKARANTTAEFYVAGKGIHPVLNGMATGADWMSAASFISMAGLIAFKGYDASVYLMGWTGGYVLLAMLLAQLQGPSHCCFNLRDNIQAGAEIGVELGVDFSDNIESTSKIEISEIPRRTKLR